MCPHRLHCAFLLLAIGITAAACGGGGGGGGVEEGTTVDGVQPASGPAAGGTRLTITGSGFADPASVTVGGNDATDVVVEGATAITCLTPRAPRALRWTWS